MDEKEFSQIRSQLERTQNQMAQLLGVSSKAIQSFEQGWRNISPHIERQTLFLLALKRPPKKKTSPCWTIRRCPPEERRNCPAWELRAGHLCWFINGTICHGEVQTNWRRKMEICRQCEVFRSVFPSL
ncbi:MAG: transcriptional regulator [Proteobacteria bacterium]|nr:transcriptional regulator [Pseudomonadota bacterium]